MHSKPQPLFTTSAPGLGLPLDRATKVCKAVDARIGALPRYTLGPLRYSLVLAVA